ncbi:hypothetical protein K469DRAFT_695866 [Zopfia rhizophila CBS 207.26]|uniref:Uncharacterized protein n=1 Tax=Zopfia rhizophila CBS 207.26 TaxID=1314779 RepID=A0A6A6EP99_9PEZI|nr:hypothetical protein K469DRAFT_695866 [Zopfia rhizophila CBS 207.26]
MMTYDWDSLERRLHRLTRIVQLAKKAEAKLISRRQARDARNTYRAETDSEPDPDFKFEHLIDPDEIDPDKIDPKGLRSFLQYILNVVKSIQDTVKQLDSNNGSASKAEQDSASNSASKGQAKQTKVKLNKTKVKLNKTKVKLNKVKLNNTAIIPTMKIAAQLKSSFWELKKITGSSTHPSCVTPNARTTP